MGRWLGRDRLKEQGGLNLLAFVKNNPISTCDPQGETSPTDVGAAGAIAGTMAAEEGCDYNGIVDSAITVVDGCELEADAIGAVAENDSMAALNAVTRVVNNLKDMTVAVGRLPDTAAAQELGIGVRFNVPDSAWNTEVNSKIMQALINNGQTFYVCSPITAGNMWNDMGQMSVFSQELMQLFDAGYTQNGFYMLPP